MTPLREAIVLPLLFLTVTLLGGLDLAARSTLTPPTPFSLVLAVLLIAALVRSGALVPTRLLHGSRTALANANGAMVIVTLFAASAQLLGALTPRSGLPNFFVDVFLLVLLVNTLVAMPDRIRLLRSLAVILGSAFVLKFVVLAGLSDPAGSRTSRVLVALFDAATFGSITQEPLHRASGYFAFLATLLFLVGAVLLPSVRTSPATAIQVRPGTALE